MTYRLGLDIGANSIGWCILSLDGEGTPTALQGLGVRVFPDGRNPKDSSSLAAERRGPRAMRRNRDRYLRRRTTLLNALSRFGLMPDQPEARREVAALDPYALRDQALKRLLRPEELGRVLFHLNQHRGFRSNRKTDRGNNEGGLIRNATAETETLMMGAGCRTLGSWLAGRHAARQGVRVRLTGSGKTAAYPFYPSRAMIEAEFEVIWQTQADLNPSLTAEMGETLRGIIFHQRPLRAPVVGCCWLEPDEFRAARALPSAQRFRIAQTVAHLRISPPGMPERALSDSERSKLFEQLYRGKDLTLDQMRKRLRLPSETDINFRDDKIKGCAAAARLGRAAVLGDEWHQWDLARQDQVVSALLDADTDEAAEAALTALGLDDQTARILAAADVVLPDGHASLSSLAMGRILPHLEAGQRYSDAVIAGGYAHHSDRRTGEIRERLPYYGEVLCLRMGTGTAVADDPEDKRFGRAPNPTVHVALNEIRRVVNAIIDQYGPPSQIVVETLRDLGRSKKQREDQEADQRSKRKAQDARRALLAEMGLPVNAGNLVRLRLWEEQATDPKNRCCPYTGTLITARTALSDAIEEDHILPFALTLDDTPNNRILVTREANRAKGRQTPFQAFGHTEQWPDIVERSRLLSEKKRWRFGADALDKLAENGDFLARHMTDSATIARWAAEYLEILAPGKVHGIPGRLTAMLRHALGLNSRSVLGKGGSGKDRTDHRHHAIDAVVVALTTRSLLQQVTRAAQEAAATERRLFIDIAPPWEGFLEDVAKAAASLVVSYKPDIGWQGALHNDTAYGAVEGAGATQPNVVVRRPLLSLAGWTPEEASKGVRDPALAAKVNAVLAGTSEEPARKAALAELTHCGRPVRRARTVERLEMKSLQTIADRRTGRPYKLVKRDGNHRTEIWRLPDGGLKMTIISIFEAAAEALGRPVGDRRPHPAAKLLMRLHKSDMVAFGSGDQPRILRVVKMSEGELALADHAEAGNLKKRNDDKTDPFKYVRAGVSRLKAEQARKIFVTPAGRVIDPGPVL